MVYGFKLGHNSNIFAKSLLYVSSFLSGRRANNLGRLKLWIWICKVNNWKYNLGTHLNVPSPAKCVACIKSSSPLFVAKISILLSSVSPLSNSRKNSPLSNTLNSSGIINPVLRDGSGGTTSLIWRRFWMLRLKHDTEGSWALSFSLNDALIDAISDREVFWLEINGLLAYLPE